MNELSLFSGAGGGVLGSKLLGWKTIGYVEYNDYCQRVIRQRIEDGIFDNAPIFGDIRAFNSEGYAASYQGLVDVITAGFPCQPFSVAGKQAGAEDPRNMWPETIRTIRTVRPKFALLENVPGILSSGYFGTILGQISEIGYHAKWCVIPASWFVDQRAGKRLWILVSSNSEGLEGVYQKSNRIDLQPAKETLSRDFWCASPRVCRKGHGVAHRMDRLKAIGNGQVPIVAATAWKFLSGK